MRSLGATGTYVTLRAERKLGGSAEALAPHRDSSSQVLRRPGVRRESKSEIASWSMSYHVVPSTMTSLFSIAPNNLQI